MTEEELEAMVRGTSVITEISTGFVETDDGRELQKAEIRRDISHVRFVQLSADLTAKELKEMDGTSLSDETCNAIIAETDRRMKTAYGFSDTEKGRQARRAFLKGEISARKLVSLVN